MSSSITGKSSTKSSIKGGGRVDLKPELEDAIVDLLLSRRDRKHPLLPRSKPKKDDDDKSERESSSSHARSHARSKFMKRLIASHERHTLSLRLNQVSLMDSSTNSTNSAVPSSSSKAAVALASSSQTAALKGNGKVRFDLIEAVYKVPNKWKAGSTKKTLVMDRSTPIDKVMKQAKDKLKMKKKVVRCFYVEHQVELELTTTLSGLQDGAVVYVTSFQPDESSSSSKKGNRDKGKEDTNAATDGEDDALPDPLDIVKQVYAERASRKRSRQTNDCGPPVLFAPHLDNLPELPSYRSHLPAALFRNKILTALDQSRVLIICGATGCGKSTQIPQYIYEGMLTAANGASAVDEKTNIVVTQPRRVAAMALAERVAVEQGSTAPGKPGSLVGYQVRLDSSVSEATKITYLTVGILLRRLTTPAYTTNLPPLANISHLVIDEVHERDINTDFCLTILRRVLVRNPHIKIILMSATNTPDLFYNYFRSEKLAIEPTILKIPGRTFPVEMVYLEDIEALIGCKIKGDHHYAQKQATSKGVINGNIALSPRAAAAIDNAFIMQLILHLVVANSNAAHGTTSKAAILVFLPGRGEIESLARGLRAQDKETDYLSIHVLHSSVTQTAQKAVFQPVQEGKTKVVLATNVAETSITIPDIAVVIDTGRVKESRFNSSARIKELVTVWTSRSSATQRAGRSGRTQQGFCYRLYTEAFSSMEMLECTTPEILRTPLDELVLQSCLLDEDRKDQQKKEAEARPVSNGTAPVDFLSRTPDPPPTDSLVDACRHLIEIDALQFVSGEDAYTRVKLTPLGYHLTQLPMDCKIGKILIVGSILGCVEPSITVAAALSSTKSIFRNGPRDKQKELVDSGFGGIGWEGGTVKGDCISLIAAYEAWVTRPNDHHRFLFAKEYGLDHNTLNDIWNLRKQFRDCMVDAGFLDSRHHVGPHSENALLGSCCLVAGLYPNVARLMRPIRGKLGFKGGRLLTKDGDVCTPGSHSFQADRVRTTAESGRDVYAVYQSKNQIIGAVKEGAGGLPQKKRVFLSEVNFISRFALLLFGGNLEVKDNFIVVDQWLKFKVGDKGRSTAILMTELRRELDMVFLHQLSGNDVISGNEVVDMVARLLQEE